MKFILVIIVGILSASSFAGSNLGLGIILGEPTGISSNYKFSESQSLDAALAFDLGENDRVQVHSTYLFRYPNSLNFDNNLLGWYWGLGGRLKVKDRRSDDDFRIGPRASIGANYQFVNVPVELFAEAALIMDIVPSTDADVDAGLGIRYYFN